MDVRHPLREYDLQMLDFANSRDLPVHCLLAQLRLAEVTPGDGDVILVHPGTYPAFRVRAGGGSTPETA